MPGPSMGQCPAALPAARLDNWRLRPKLERP